MNIAFDFFGRMFCFVLFEFDMSILESLSLLLTSRMSPSPEYGLLSIGLTIILLGMETIVWNLSVQSGLSIVSRLDGVCARGRTHELQLTLKHFRSIDSVCPTTKIQFYLFHSHASG